MLLDRYSLGRVCGRAQLIWRVQDLLVGQSRQRWAIAATLGLLVLGVGARESVAQSGLQLVPQQLAANSGVASYQLLYVNADTGSNRADGTAARPLKTVTRALEIAMPNTVIVLAPGQYTRDSGEVFPIQLKPGVTIQGAPGSGDRAAVIEGGGEFTSPTRSRQNAAILAADRAGIAQVAISNPEGYGVWVESANPTILESAFINNHQTGLYIAGGSPRVQGSYFSGNRVAGLIVFGRGAAIIHQNTFDNTGDAIRVMDEATPDIAANQMVNNEAGLVVIGNAQPTLRNNQISGNRQNGIVEVAASIRPPQSATAATTRAAIATPTQQPESTLPIIEPSSQLLAEPAIAPAVESSAELSAESTSLAQPELTPEILPGAPGSALAALSAGIGSEPKADIEASNTPGSLLLNLRRRRREIREREARSATQGTMPNPTSSNSRPINRPAVSAPVNNNRLSVPSSSIPVGSGHSSIIFSPPSSGVGAPPAPPSRAQALGLYYRVFVEASDPFVQDEIRSVVPDAFRTRFEGRAMMQVGAFPTEEEAEARRRLLEDNNYDALVEYIR